MAKGKLAAALLTEPLDERAVHKEMRRVVRLPDAELSAEIEATRKETRFDGSDVVRAYYIDSALHLLECAGRLPLDVRSGALDVVLCRMGSNRRKA